MLTGWRRVCYQITIWLLHIHIHQNRKTDNIQWSDRILKYLSGLYYLRFQKEDAFKIPHLKKKKSPPWHMENCWNPQYFMSCFTAMKQNYSPLVCCCLLFTSEVCRLFLLHAQTMPPCIFQSNDYWHKLSHFKLRLKKQQSIFQIENPSQSSNAW